MEIETAPRSAQASKQTAGHPGLEARAQARHGSGWYAALARAGLVAKGVSFGIVGALAIRLALGDGGKATSRQGALETLAQNAFGEVLLVALAVGFAAYAIWRFVQASAERDERGDEKGKASKWGRRAGSVGRGLIYGGLTFSTIKIVFGSAQQSQNQKAHQTAGTVLSWPGGRWIVGIIGLAIIGAAFWNLYRGVARTFEDAWQLGKMNEAERRWGSRAGVVGHIARFVVFGLIGVFATKAAIDYNPTDAIGLDGALQRLSQTSYGPYLLGLTSPGLVASGPYGPDAARYGDVSVDRS